MRHGNLRTDLTTHSSLKFSVGMQIEWVVILQFLLRKKRGQIAVLQPYPTTREKNIDSALTNQTKPSLKVDFPKKTAQSLYKSVLIVFF